METLIAVCLLILVIELSFLLAVMAVTFVQIRKAAKAAEVLTYRVDSQVEAFGHAMRSGWFHIFECLAAIMARVLAKRDKHE